LDSRQSCTGRGKPDLYLPFDPDRVAPSRGCPVNKLAGKDDADRPCLRYAPTRDKAMTPLLVLIVVPALIGVASAMVFRRIRGASLAAAVGSPMFVYLWVKSVDPSDTWSPLATLLVSPLVIAVAVTTVLLCAGRSHIRRHGGWDDS
jgi:hypothetical protein